MSEKLLTVSVAAYNMEKYIAENLRSMLEIDEADRLEIFVVDDGGTDSTYSLAKEFEEKYPGIVYAVHKENGGYGSVQNYSMRHATGKYFKILDGDDWFDSEGLSDFLKKLEQTDADAVVTNYFKGPSEDELEEVRVTDKVGCCGEVTPGELEYPVGMWALTYKTSVLKKCDLTLPEHTLYTDRIFSTLPFKLVGSVLIFDRTVYCYRTGRDGQSVSVESRIKHIDEYLRVTGIVSRFSASVPDNKYILLKAAYAYKVTIRALLLMPVNRENRDKLMKYEAHIRKNANGVYRRSASLKTVMGWVITFLRATGYYGYWLLAVLPEKLVKF